MGKLLLMFFAGLEIDLSLFRKARNKVYVFGLLITFLPWLLGTAVGLLFGYPTVSAIVIGSLLASHTLLGLPIVARLGLTRLEPITITVGATVMSDTLSLIVFSVCVAVFQTGFSVYALGLQLVEIAIFVPGVLVGVSYGGGWLLRKVVNDESAYFVVMIAMLTAVGIFAISINLPGIVGAFLAGLAINSAVRHKPAKDKLQFFGDSIFIPMFFVVTGFLIVPIQFFDTIAAKLALVIAIIFALLVGKGKGIAAEIAGRAFSYSSAARKTMWSLTLPQVAATLAAALVAYGTTNQAGERLLDAQMLNVVIVVMLITAILGPVLTERFGSKMPPKATAPNPLTPRVPVSALSEPP